jgi:NAD(P)-dependent dehydrogenase (short-subunit alcohol dehydrogenase family)
LLPSISSWILIQSAIHLDDLNWKSIGTSSVADLLASMSYSFQGRKVLVTGGAGGLGAATVRKFIKCGATIYAIDFNEERLNNLQKELPSLQVVVADLSKWDEARQAVENLGPMDHLVNNAGFAIPASCLETTEEQIDM